MKTNKPRTPALFEKERKRQLKRYKRMKDFRSEVNRGFEEFWAKRGGKPV